jgi:tetratricopeptide (TPR) repeat protein
MMFRKFIALLSAVSASTAIAVGTARADEVVVTAPDKSTLSNLSEATTKHFVIVAAMSESELRRRATRLEQMHALLATIAPERSDNRLVIYLTDGIDPIQKMAHADYIAGYYVPTARGAFAVSPKVMQNVMPGFTPELVLFHEYTHHMLLQTNDSYFPGWVTEGLAELFSTAEIKPNGEIVVGAANVTRSYSIFSMSRWPVERLLRSDAIKVSKDESIEKYSRGGLLIHYLLMDPKRAPMFGKFIALINSGVDPVEAGKQTFGDLKKLDTALDVYRKQTRVTAVNFAADKIAYSKDFTIRQLRDDEAQALPIRLQLLTDEDHEHPGELVPKARKTAAAYPASVVAQDVLAEVEYEAGNFAEAGAAADRALARDPANVRAMLTKGQVLGQKAIASKTPADWSAARAWFVKANRIDPNFAWTFVLLYDSYRAAGQAPSPSILKGLRRAAVLAPQDDGVRIRMALQMVREGDLAGARSMIAPVAFAPHGKPDAPAAKFYPLLTAGGESAGLLAKADELGLPVNSFIPKKKDDKPAEGKGGGKPSID